MKVSASESQLLSLRLPCFRLLRESLQLRGDSDRDPLEESDSDRGEPERGASKSGDSDRGDSERGDSER